MDRSDSPRWSSRGAAASVSGSHFVDLADGGAVERPAPVLPESSHMLAAFAGLDEGRAVPKGVGSGPAHAGWPGEDRLVRSHRGRDVCEGQKRGESVRNTKCGKGSKIMALTTGDGLPLAATVHSASPGEATLIEGLSQQRVLKRQLPRLIYGRAADSEPSASHGGRGCSWRFRFGDETKHMNLQHILLAPTLLQAITAGRPVRDDAAVLRSRPISVVKRPDWSDSNGSEPLKPRTVHTGNGRATGVAHQRVGLDQTQQTPRFHAARWE